MSYDIDMIPEKVIRLSEIYVPRHVRRSHSRTQEEGWLVHPTLLASSRTPPVAPLPPYQLSAPSSTSSGRPCLPPAGGAQPHIIRTARARPPNIGGRRHVKPQTSRRTENRPRDCGRDGDYFFRRVCLTNHGRTCDCMLGEM